MEPIKVMINGLPGNISWVVAEHVMDDNRFELIPVSLPKSLTSKQRCPIKC